ncbi:hypothetical protein KP806_07540 [Paenibacillus sp. N4]|uniref:hypothetical protein n=1 Tax=Paenibacillus vietnamensis TaxID=2590547 RepID=UPI001CD0832E|nr:hypothetical protein [Paenibacillus vietnamensis]MCA0754899.1 hypothetical protein [Paenibacillus vietnamensis]
MAYTPTTWLDRAVQYARRFYVRSNGGSDKNLLPPFNDLAWTLHENTRMKQANFNGKVTGSTTEQPHLALAGSASSLPSPALSENFGGSYSKLFALDAQIQTNTFGGTGNIAFHRFSFNLIEHVTRTYGIPLNTMTTADAVAWLKANVTKLTGNWHGYGSGPAGNKAYFALWRNATSTWATNVASHTSATVALITRTTTDATSYIDVNGFIHGLAYADAATTTASTINTDFVELEVYMSANSVPIADYFLELNATVSNQQSYVTVQTVPGQSYTISAVFGSADSNYRFRAYDGVGVSGTQIFSGGTNPRTFTAVSTNTTIVLSSQAAGTFTFTNPQLELGSSATAFLPMQSYTITQSPGIITQAGTPITAAVMNAIETGISWAHGLLDAATNAATANALVKRDVNGDASLRRLTLTQADGTAPAVVTSKTLVTNWNADRVDGFHFRNTNGYMEYSTDGVGWERLSDYTGRTPYAYNNSGSTGSLAQDATANVVSISGSGLLTEVKIQDYTSGGSNPMYGVEIVLDGVVFPLFYDSGSQPFAVQELAGGRGFLSASDSSHRQMVNMTSPMPFSTSAVIRLKNVANSSQVSFDYQARVLALLD